MEKLCGNCSLEQELSLTERIELAKSRLPNVTYICPRCNQKHSLQWKFGSINKESSLMGTPVQKSMKKGKTQDLEQLSLF
ncbi:hypothetical protein ACFVS2_26610 [Brevibacillus sp. NPDC058079]|uniref:hypothetical protein n=1 Tax=Brevibacillus sp. NPDC058079 TaxID=3346330 RepID=UPI0036E31426